MQKLVFLWRGSYDVSVIQWITNVIKMLLATCYIFFARTCNVMTTSVKTMQFFIDILFTLKEIKFHLNGHMINREGSFNKFYMK